MINKTFPRHLTGLAIASALLTSLRLEAGTMALFSDKTDHLSTLLQAKKIQVWDGSEWINALGSELISYSYVLTDGEGEAISGYTGSGRLYDFDDDRGARTWNMGFLHYSTWSRSPLP